MSAEALATQITAELPVEEQDLEDESARQAAGADSAENAASANDQAADALNDEAASQQAASDAAAASANKSKTAAELAKEELVELQVARDSAKEAWDDQVEATAATKERADELVQEAAQAVIDAAISGSAED